MGAGVIARGLLVLAALLAAAGCRSRSASSSAPPVARAPAHAASKAPAPLSQAELPTTDGAIAVGNLEAQVAAEEDEAKHAPRDAEVRIRLASLLGVRAKYEGRIADRERASELAEEALRLAPERADAWLARADARAGVHRFDDALADLAEAEKRGAPGPRLRAARASILQARGLYEDALALRRAAVAERPTIDALASEAALLAEMGRTKEALPVFDRAVRTYRDVSPFPVAGTWFEEGVALESDGDAKAARAFFQAAHDRLPAYSHAALHLARLLPRDEALALLRPFLERADDPEIFAELATLERDAGNAAAADALRDRARARYEALHAAHPEAYADHAGWFWLDVGADAKKALAYGEENLALRKTPRAYELVLLAALRAGDANAACEAAIPAARSPYATEMLRSIATEAASRCPAKGP